MEIAKRCNLEINLGEYFLPDFPVPDGMTVAEFFRADRARVWNNDWRKYLTRLLKDFARIAQALR